MRTQYHSNDSSTMRQFEQLMGISEESCAQEARQREARRQAKHEEQANIERAQLHAQIMNELRMATRTVRRRFPEYVFEITLRRRHAS
jgi:hypothetical protein